MHACKDTWAVKPRFLNMRLVWVSFCCCTACCQTPAHTHTHTHTHRNTAGAYERFQGVNLNITNCQILAYTIRLHKHAQRTEIPNIRCAQFMTKNTSLPFHLGVCLFSHLCSFYRNKNLDSVYYERSVTSLFLALFVKSVCKVKLQMRTN